MKKGMGFVGLLLTLAFTGCQHPMGLRKEEWNALPPEKQAEYRRQQTEINEQKRRERAAEQERLRLEAAEKARIEQERVRAAYANARYGDIITVTIEGGTIDLNGGRRAYEPVKFDLIKGERKRVEFVQQGQSLIKTTVEARFSEDGNTFYFDEKAKDRISLIGNAWERGQSYGPLTITDPFSESEAQGIKISIRYKRW